MKPQYYLFIAIIIIQLMSLYGIQQSTKASQDTSYRTYELETSLDKLTISLDRLSSTQENFIYAVERLKMYNQTIGKLLIDGVYFNGQDYYCVWTANRTYCDIMDLDPSLNCVNVTAFHELTHAMIDSDYEHFCGEYNESFRDK